MTTNTKTARKTPAPKTPALMLTKSDSVQVAIDAKPFNHEVAIQVGTLNGSVENNLLMLLLSGKALPTWKDFTEAVKERNKTLPVNARIAIPNSKTQGFNTINQAMANVAMIRDIANEFPTFNPLMAWNAKAQTAKRVTEPTISAILKLARAVKNGAKPEATPMEIFEKGLKLAYKGALEFKNDKKAQSRVSKLLALAQADGIILEIQTENDSEE